jgi:DNA gyrase subunit B
VASPEFVEFLAQDEPVTDILRLRGTDTFTETVPVLDEKGHMTPQEVERRLEVDIAARWGTGYDTELRAFVNVIATPKGGTHVSGFEQGLLKTFNEAMRSAKVLKVNDDDVTKDDVLEGLTTVVTVRLAEPQFEGQTKEILGTPQVRTAVRKIVAAELRKFLTSTRRAEKAQAKLVMEKVSSAAKTRIAARQHSETQRRKNALESSACPPSWPTAAPPTTAAELFIVEGDSALGTAKLAANSEFQALLPIRGKILNVQKASVGDMLKNVECASIIQVVGAGLGTHLRHRGRRYRQDHLHGRRRLRRRPHPLPAGDAVLQVHAGARRPGPGLLRRTPAAPHRAVQPQEGDGQVRLHLLRRRAAAEAGRADQEGRRWKDPVQRYKGLGEMDAKQLAETTMDRRYLALRRITIDDAEAAMEGLRAADGLRRRTAEGVPGAGGLRRRCRGVDA